MALSRNLFEAFVVLNSTQSASVEDVDASLYERLDNSYNNMSGCQLVSCYIFASDWQNSEMHPNGDELVILLTGEVTFVLEQSAGDEYVTLAKQGDFVLVRKGVWHTAKTEVESTLLFVTPGEGTEHRA
ncbi:cupin domain-containing protein [Teredinibacter turnerae]|uniref:cupin domain-containing protein n=1 Tax=Teredinibacter turnerae TaxID=2426 RepID=UPI000382CB4A|nr:cupin domain-containing protein [Teredinibacter turnerae]